MGRRVLITGGSRGIGLACAERLAADDWDVVVVARDVSAVTAFEAIALDVADLPAWPEAMRRVGDLHGLVCAAGVLGPIGDPAEVDPVAFARTLEVNVVGTFAALHHGLPALRANGGAAVLFSGGGATAPLPRYDAYAASKAAVVRLAENASGEVRVNAVAPGFVATRIHEGTLAAGPEAAGAEYFERTRRDLEGGGVGPQMSAELVAFLLSDEAAGIGGRLISAQWDPWRDAAFRRRLREDPDLAALRRIDEQFFTRVRATGAR